MPKFSACGGLDTTNKAYWSTSGEKMGNMPSSRGFYFEKEANQGAARRCTIWRATQKDLTFVRIFTRSWVIGSVLKLWSWFSDMFETHRSLFIRKNPDAKIPILTYFLIANVKWNRDFHDFSEKKNFRNFKELVLDAQMELSMQIFTANPSWMLLLVFGIYCMLPSHCILP